MKILFTFFILFSLSVHAQLNSSIVEFMQAEQILSEGNSILTVPRQIPGKILPALSNYGVLPSEFKPSQQTEHQLITLLIPEKDLPKIHLADHISMNAKDILFVEKAGRRYVRFFILPTPSMRTYYAEEIAKYQADSKIWLGYQQSSGRTLTVIDSENHFAPICLKLSLNERMGGGNRLIEDYQTVRGPKVSELLYHAPKSALSSWSYFPETAGVEGPNGKGGLIIREFPPEMLADTHFAIPLFALVNSKRSTLYLDELAQAANKTRQAFLLEEVIFPLIDTYADLSLRLGLIPELHQQNTLLLINKQTKQIDSILFRDLDAVSTDHILRTSTNITETGRIKVSVEDLAARRAVNSHHFNYKYFLRMEGISFLFGGSFLTNVNTSKLLKMADQRLLQYANQFFQTDSFQSIDDLKNVAQKASELSPSSANSWNIPYDRQQELARAFHAQVKAKKAVFLKPIKGTKLNYALQNNRIVALTEAKKVVGVADAGKAVREVENLDNIKVTVILPTFNNSQAEIDRSLQSILNQTHRNLEILVIDDHSSNGIFDYLKEKYQDTRLHLIRLSENIGLFGVGNFALKNLATGDFITWQDSDDFSHPNRIEKQLSHAIRYDLDAVGTSIRHIKMNGDVEDICTAYCNEREPTPTRPVLEHPTVKNSELQFLSGGSKSLYKTEILAELGGYNSTQRFSQDMVLNSRVSRLYRTGAVSESEPLYYWLERQDSLTTSPSTGLKSWKRIKQVLFTIFPEKAKLNNLIRDHKLQEYTSRVVERLEYPENAVVSDYSGPAMPEGKYKNFDPQSAENLNRVLDKAKDASIHLQDCSDFYRSVVTSF